MTAPIAEPRPLHPLQSAVVAHRGSNLVVEAPAGTGKTETLARRAVSLLDDLAFRPHQLWVCSFTRSSSRSIKQRILDLSYQGHFVTFGTLHSLALRVIRRHGWRAGLRADVEVLSRKKQTDIIKALMDNLPVKLPAEVKASRLAELFSLQLNTAFSLEQLCHKENLSAHLPSIQLVQSRLYEYQDYHDLIDYDGIIFDCVSLVEQSGAFIADYDCKHLLVDEAQDMSGLQLELISAFAKSGIQITAVGDRMQAVYSWRGADPNAMMAYEKFSGNWTKLILNQNFRCPECVLQVANQISARHQGGVRLYSGIAGGSASSSRYPTEQAEADVVADRVADLLKQGCAPSDIAILYRSSMHSLKLQEAF